jgi:hypothetical protein
MLLLGLRCYCIVCHVGLILIRCRARNLQSVKSFSGYMHLLGMRLTSRRLELHVNDAWASKLTDDTNALNEPLPWDSQQPTAATYIAARVVSLLVSLVSLVSLVTLHGTSTSLRSEEVHEILVSSFEQVKLGSIQRHRGMNRCGAACQYDIVGHTGEQDTGLQPHEGCSSADIVEAEKCACIRCTADKRLLSLGVNETPNRLLVELHAGITRLVRLLSMQLYFLHRDSAW